MAIVFRRVTVTTRQVTIPRYDDRNRPERRVVSLRESGRRERQPPSSPLSDELVLPPALMAAPIGGVSGC
jgi:hypothetical protein